MTDNYTFPKSDRRFIQEVVPALLGGGAYSSGDQVGGVMEIEYAVETTERDHAVIDTIMVIDKSRQNAQLDILVFDTDPSASISSIDNTVFSITDAGVELVVQTARLLPISYIDLITSSISKCPVKMPFRAKGGTRSLWMTLITRGTPTYLVGDLRVKVYFDQS
jgi:hypothetical protein